MEDELSGRRLQGRRRDSRTQKVAIETDGWAFHSDAVDFQIDRERQNAIALLGWQVLRFTWLDLTEYPARVISVIRFAISAC